VVLDPHRWLELRRFRPLYVSGAMSLREIAMESGLNRRTVSKYLKDLASAAPPKREEADQWPRRVVDEVAPLIDAMLRSEILLKGKVIHERLAQEYGVTINYQRVKLYLQEARPRIAKIVECAGEAVLQGDGIEHLPLSCAPRQLCGLGHGQIPWPQQSTVGLTHHLRCPCRYVATNRPHAEHERADPSTVSTVLPGHTRAVRPVRPGPPRSAAPRRR